MQGIQSFASSLVAAAQQFAIPAIFGVMFVWGCVEYMTSGGKNGKGTILASVVGMGLGLMAVPLTTTLMGFARGGGG